MNLPSPLRLRRPRLLATLLALALVGTWGQNQNPISAKLTLDEELALIRAFFTQRGKTTATATEQDWIDAVVSIRGPIRPARTFWNGAVTPTTPEYVSGFLTACAPAGNGGFRAYGYGDTRPAPGAQVRANSFGVTYGYEPSPLGKLVLAALQGYIPAGPGNEFLTAVDGGGTTGVTNQQNGGTYIPYLVGLDNLIRTQLPRPTGVNSAYGVGISSDGRTIVGEGTEGSGASARTVTLRWEKTTDSGLTFGGSVTVDTFPGSPHTHPTAVSGDGSTTVGYYFNPQSRIRAWQRANGTFNDLGALPNQTNSEARATTQNGATVVGTSGHAFIWTLPTGMNPLQIPSGATSSEARSISSDGAFIGGSSRDASFNQRAELWLPDMSNVSPQFLFRAFGLDLRPAVLREITAISKNPDGSYVFAGNATLNGAPRGFVAHLEAGDGTRPAVTSSPVAQAVGAGGTAVFSVNATNATGYQWRRNGVAISGATGPTLTLTNVQAAQAGDYTCIVVNAAAAIASAPAPLTVAPTLSRLANVSVRTTAGTAANPLIVGFTLGGGGKNVLLRAVGPTLGTFGVPGTLDDPRLALFTGAGMQTAQNDDWGGGAGLTASFDAVGAFRLPAASKDAVLLNSLPAGGYTAQVSGAANTSGVVLLEAYDSDAGSPLARYTNLSARNQVGTGGNILIVGFNIVGNGPKNLLIRAVGPALTQFGVAGALADPQLAIFNAAGVQVNQNDDWGGGATLASAFTSVGAFGLPITSKDAALSVTLQPGSYTAQVSGVNNTTGVALAEIYELP